MEFFSESADGPNLEDLSDPVRASAEELIKAGFEVSALGGTGYLGLGETLLRVKVKTKLPSRPRHDIHREEFVLLGGWDTYPGFPPDARFDRFDFPRGLPHINQTRKSSPVWPCLTAEPLRTWFQGRTIVDLARRVERWLSDAASGRLMLGDVQTFEPVFLPPEREFMIDGRVQIRAPGYCVASAPQLVTELEARAGSPDVEGVFRARYIPLHAVVNPLPPVVSFDRMLGQDESWDTASERFDFFGAVRTGTHAVNVLPGLVVSIAETGTHIGPPPDEIDGFADWCAEMGVAESLNGHVSQCFSAWQGVRFVPVTFLIRRPRPLAGNPTGVPNIDCVTVVLDGDDHAIIPVLNLRPLHSEAIRRYAGSKTGLPRSLLVGAGALGSKLATHLVRSGTTQLDVVDPDLLLEHNLARHDLRRVHVGLPKAEAVIDELSRMSRDFEGNAYVSSVEDGLRSAEIAPADYNVIIDSSASPGMHFVLSYFDDLPRIFSAFTIPGGSLGIACLEGPDRNPRIEELEGSVYSLASSRDDIAKWLKERFLDYVGVGGCRDITAVIADDSVSLHAARFSQLLRGSALQEDAGAIWIHDSDGSLTRLPVGPSQILEVDGWSVRVGAWARETIFRMLDEHAPDEVAGYLHGFRDTYRKQLIVIHASVEPLLVQSPTEVEIDTSQYSNPAENTLEYLGTWHTHPEGDTGTSTKDEGTVSRLVGLPVLRHPLMFLIAAPGELGAHLRG